MRVSHGCQPGACAPLLAEALGVFQEMKEDSLPCDELVYNTLLEGSSSCDSSGMVATDAVWLGCVVVCDGKVGGQL